MTESQAKICRVIQAVERFVGRTKLQKTVYIAQRLGYPFLESFSWRDFGPFSPELASEVDELVALGMVVQEPMKSGKYDSSAYRLTESGQQFLSLLEERVPKSDSLGRLVRGLHQNRNARQLELAASILYMEELGQDRATAVKTVLDAKPKYKTTPLQVVQALEDLEVLAKHFRSREHEGA
jgi:uncharacterized protein YwgA